MKLIKPILEFSLILLYVLFNITPTKKPLRYWPFKYLHTYFQSNDLSEMP